MEEKVIFYITLFFCVVGLITTIKWILKKLYNVVHKALQKVTKNNQQEYEKAYKAFQKRKLQSDIYILDNHSKIKKHKQKPDDERIQYYESAYFFAKHEPYVSIVNDIGKYGEYLIYDYLKDYQNQDCKFLFNCYLPKEDNQTTEIDVMMITHSGIIVFESKNYSGWIFGNAFSEYWTQSLRGKEKTSHKEHFYNPVKQNATHIKYLRQIVGDNIPIYSVIVFSERCKLKQVSVNLPDVHVIKRNQVSMKVSSIMLHNQDRVSTEKINNLYNQLYPYTQVSEEVKKQHIENIQQNIANSH